MIGALAWVPATRLLRTPRAYLPLVGWLLVGVVAALLARADRAPNGADHVLVGAFAAFVVPLVAYAAVAAALGGQSLATAIAPVVTFGASAERGAAVTIAVAALTSAIPAALVGALVAVMAHGIDDPPAAHDALVSAYAGALGGVAYAAYFALGATFGKRGGGRAWLLVLDWVLGSNRTVLALVTPRGHLRNLMGAAPPAGLSERASAVALLVMAAAFALLAIVRTRRA